MRTFFFASFLCLACCNLQAQQLDSLWNELDGYFELSKNDSMLVQRRQDSIQTKRKRDSLYDLVYGEYWDTTKINPYPKSLKQAPYLIEFADSTYASPIARKKVITSRYGWRRGRPHRGIDIDLVTGDDVMAMFDGIVRFVNYSSGHGKTIIIRHGNGLETTYAHLSKYSVKVNDTVKKGSVIGKGGTTGNARGSHLHLVVSYLGHALNAQYLFDFGPRNRIKNQQTWITSYWYTPRYHNSRRSTPLHFFDTYEAALASQEKQNKRQIHIVRRGDTLSEISDKYNISVAKLCRDNSIKKNSILRVGKKLVIN